MDRWPMFSRKSFYGGGNENILAFNEQDGAIFKCNILSNTHNIFSKFFENFNGQNKIFPENEYTFVEFRCLENKEETLY